MRVCQPAPVALKALITSGDKRMVVICLVGVFCGPRCFMPKVFCKLRQLRAAKKNEYNNSSDDEFWALEKCEHALNLPPVSQEMR